MFGLIKGIFTKLKTMVLAYPKETVVRDEYFYFGILPFYL